MGILGLFSLETRDLDQDGIMRRNSDCSKKVLKICELKGCVNGCLNMNKNKRPPKRLSKKAKRKYCSKVFCLTTTECVCPMALDPVCNSEGNQVADNEECAICQGEDPNNLFPCMVTSEPGVF